MRVNVSSSALRLNNLCKSFGKIRAVDHLSLDVQAGQMVGFLGPNGAGKSTTLYMTSRLVRPSAGSIEIFGHNVWKDFKNAVRHVGIMAQEKRIMPNMVVPLLRNEIAKAVRTKLPYFGFIAIALMCLLAFVVTDEITDAQNLNAWGYVSLSMQMVFTDIGLIFIAIFSSMLIAEETSFGTVRTILSTPVLRWEFYVAKTLTGLLYAGIMLLVGLAISVCLGMINYQFGDVTDSMGLIYNQKIALGNFILALFLSWIPLAAIVTYGLFISTIVRKPGQAVAVTIGSIYIIDFTKHIMGIESYIFTKYIGFPWQVFSQLAQGVDYQWAPEVWNMVTMSFVYFLITFFAGLIIFSTRNLNN